jgi:adenosylcobinamide kinase/adenosylcobinamide-phosphate guanylyltransferase
MYVATARKWDGDFQKDRPPSKSDDRWVNIEKKTLGEINFSGNVAVIDCVTLVN